MSGLLDQFIDLGNSSEDESDRTSPMHVAHSVRRRASVKLSAGVGGCV
jgi:hypothetical protein